MENLLLSIIRIVADTPPDKVLQLGQCVRSLKNIKNIVPLNSWAVTPQAKQRLTDLVDCWQLTDVPPEELAGMLAGASYAYHQAKTEESLELVWTGPPSELVSTRKTEQALLEVINASNKNLFLTCFVSYKAISILESMCKAISRGVEVSILMESSDKPGDGIFVDAIGKMRELLPEAKIYYWANKQGVYEGGKVHAKIAVADAHVCFVSSANLTGYAMEKNMEAGILIHGGPIPEKLHEHLNALVITKVVKLS